MSKITQPSRAVASLTNQPSLATAQGLQLPTPRAAASKVTAPEAVGECGQGAGEPEGGPGWVRARWSGKWKTSYLGGGMRDRSSFPSFKAFC